ncbi:MAG: hypothetical protein Q4D51_12250 [Eubacteriales bacterium]|nr:hypothetical protein [Eubacteriales bacterium]
MTDKVKYIAFFCVLGLLLTGCNDVVDLTDEQSNLISEYAAQLLLKYDRYFDDRISDGEYQIKLTNDEQSEELTQGVTTTEMVTEALTETTTEQQTEEITTESNDRSEVDSQQQTTVVGQEGDIAKIAGIKGASIVYKDFLVTKQYPAIDEDGKFIYLEASRGYSLLVVRFRVKNTTDNNIDISLIDSGIDYRVVCNDKNAANPMLTILMDDLGTLETTVKPNEEQEAVLVFQIADSMKKSMDSIELKVKYNDADNVIKIK